MQTAIPSAMKAVQAACVFGLVTGIPIGAAAEAPKPLIGTWKLV
jgi:hypothetical protein